jgi:glycerophosphoryl diester phosphodiesterase
MTKSWTRRRSPTSVFPGRRVRRCRANVVVANRWLALFGVAGWAGRRRLPLLVWTLDSTWELTRWLQDPRVWMVTTNYPRRAATLRRAVADVRSR